MPVLEKPAPDKVISLSDLIDNMEKNGYTQAFGQLMVATEAAQFRGGKFKYKEDVTAACALGQGMLNLNLMTVTLETSSWEDESAFRNFVKRVATLNDDDKLAPDVIARKVRAEFKKHLGLKLNGYTFGNVHSLGHSIR